MQKNITEYWMKDIHDEDVRQATAIVAPHDQMTFGELFDGAAQIATMILPQVQPHLPVEVFLPKCADAVASDMAILYAGAVYNNLDTDAPPERTTMILRHIRPQAIITSRKWQKKLEMSETDEIPVFFVEDAAEVFVDEEAVEARLAGVIDTDPCCIINTSGSTGTPKGVVMNHRSIIDFMDNAMTALSLDGSEVIGSLSPVYFDIYTLEFCLTLAKKAQMVLIPHMYAAFPEKLAAYLEEKAVNFLFWVPTVMVNMANLDLLSKHPLAAMRKVLFAGEVFPMKHLTYWHEHLPQVEFVNMYGPIEITVDCLYHVLTDKDYEEGTLPIGRPFRNTDVMILDEDDHLCADGETGELCVRGTSLAMGYYRDPEKTARAFTQNPLNDAYPETIYRTGDLVYQREDGAVMFVGRRDFQVKHLGYRIELPEIEAVATALPFIDNACVLYDKEKKQIVLVYEAKEEKSPREIREGIGRVLPKYCLPTTFHYVAEMPRNPNGKIDRNLIKGTFLA